MKQDRLQPRMNTNGNNELDRRRSNGAWFFRVLLLAAFAVWFGGFFFYVAIVVPIGTEVLGTATAQGMITRRVTFWLNVVNAIAVVFIVFDLLFAERFCPGEWRFTRFIRIGTCVVMIVSLIALFYLHPVLDALIDAEQGRVTDRKKFYQLHRIYLWLSTLQWLAGFCWLTAFVSGWQRQTDR